MIPKLHQKGSSFKGAAAYLLHDTDRASTSERVGWTKALNLATQNPQVAWRIMAATAMDQKRLKEEAGIKATGRKSASSVLHFSLAWSPEEAAGLSREEMMRASMGALAALGAADRQALVICHTDTEHPHVHVLLNRVSPDDGRMLSSSKEKLKLSKWAQSYEEERGTIYCEERVLNNAARDREEYTRAEKETPRPHLEEGKNDQSQQAKDLTSAQKAEDAALARLERKTRADHRKSWKAIHEALSAKRTHILKAAKRKAAKQAEIIREAYRPKWRDQMNRHRAEEAAFIQNEASLLGQVQNTFQTLDFKEVVRSGEASKALRQAFSYFASGTARLQALKDKQGAQRGQLQAEQNAKEQSAKARIRAEANKKLDAARQAFLEEREALAGKQGQDMKTIRQKWRRRRADRRAAWRVYHAYQHAQRLKAEAIKARKTHAKGKLASRFNAATKNAPKTSSKTGSSDAQDMARMIRARKAKNKHAGKHIDRDIE